MSDRNHVLSMYYELLPSGRRYRCLKVKPRAKIIHSIPNQTYKLIISFLEVCMVDGIVILYAAHCLL